MNDKLNLIKELLNSLPPASKEVEEIGKDLAEQFKEHAKAYSEFFSKEEEQ